MHQAQVIHQLPGRLRIRLPEAKGDRAFFEEIKISLLPQEGVAEVDVNPTTGSILIRYDPDLQDGFDERLAGHAQSEQLFTLSPKREQEEHGRIHSVEDVFRKLSSEIKRETHDAIDLKEVFPLAIAAYDFFFVKRSRPTPLWMTLLIFAFSSYIDLHRAESHQPVMDSIDALRAEIASLRTELRIQSHG
jgi:hypothetical protein